MKLGDQLKELRVGILRDKSDLVAGDADSFWTDEQLLAYIEDGERRFARRVMCLRDGTTPRYTQIKLREGVRDYPLDPAVFAVMSARPVGAATDLVRTGHALVTAPREDTELSFDPAEVDAWQPGSPRGFWTDETDVYANDGVVTLSIAPLPDATTAGTVLQLRVVRVPCVEYKLDNLKRESEIPKDYQLDVLEWAAFRAKRHNDADIGSSPPAADHEAAFERAIANALRDMRARRGARTAIRFGGNGFTWSR